MHWPIAFLSLAYGLDALYGATTYLNTTVVYTTLGLTLSDLTRASHYLLSLGILTAVPAVMSGGQQLVKILQNGGLYEADKKTMRAKVKVAFAHAALNDLVVVASIYSWYTRRGEKGMAPKGLELLMSVVLFPVLMFSANLGGTLTYNFGVGMNIGKKNKTG